MEEVDCGHITNLSNVGCLVIPQFLLPPQAESPVHECPQCGDNLGSQFLTPGGVNGSDSHRKPFFLSNPGMQPRPLDDSIIRVFVLNEEQIPADNVSLWFPHEDLDVSESPLFPE